MFSSTIEATPELFEQYNINPNTWEIHDAYCLSGMDKSLLDKSLIRTCGSLHDARKSVRKLARRSGASVLLYDIKGPLERLARAIGRPVHGGVRKGA